LRDRSIEFGSKPRSLSLHPRQVKGRSLSLKQTVLKQIVSTMTLMLAGGAAERAIASESDGGRRSVSRVEIAIIYE